MFELLYVALAVLDRALGHKRHLEVRRAFVRERLRGHDVSSVLGLAAQISPLPVNEDVWAGAPAIDPHTKTLDAIHLATCTLVDATLLSTDHVMLQVATAMGIPVHPASSL